MLLPLAAEDLEVGRPGPAFRAVGASEGSNPAVTGRGRAARAAPAPGRERGRTRLGPRPPRLRRPHHSALHPRGRRSRLVAARGPPPPATTATSPGRPPRRAAAPPAPWRRRPRRLTAVGPLTDNESVGAAILPRLRVPANFDEREARSRLPIRGALAGPANGRGRHAGNGPTPSTGVRLRT